MTMEKPHSDRFASPEEEIAYLKAELARREQTPLPAHKEEQGREVLEAYGKERAASVLAPSYRLGKKDITRSVDALHAAQDKTQEILALVGEKGIKNALTVLEKIGDAHLTDNVHRSLVAHLHEGVAVAGLKEGAPLFKALHLSLFEVALPERQEGDAHSELASMLSAMEQFYAGMQAVGESDNATHYAIEIAVQDKADDIVLYVAVPTEYVDLFEKQALSLFPHAVLTLQRNDYNIFVEGGSHLISVAGMKKHPLYPLRTHDTFENNPLNVILNTLSKIEREGGGAAIQFIVNAKSRQYDAVYRRIVDAVANGEKPRTAIRKSTLGGELFETAKDLFVQKKADDHSAFEQSHTDTKALEAFERKLTSSVGAVNIRIAVSSHTAQRAQRIMRDIWSGFHQFQDPSGNRLTFSLLKGGRAKRALKAFSFREYHRSRVLPLSYRELATLVHFPSEVHASSPQFRQSRAKGAAAPVTLPQEGTLLGENDYRGVVTGVRLTAEDRLRHFYVIGQTGTGKTTLLKNMIVQDIEEGAGVCMIDPHGSDIEDVLAAVPPHRADDVIYFDPGRTDPVMGLNMLEFDPTYPEQKTFVVNELFAIFQKLYSATPESMGPMFEQYFRNATLLVLEDQETGSTLLDVSRILADAAFRQNKLERATNPVVVQFWREIATKAGGEAALENIVPYITSKFDVFTANDYMRPIIGQQRSAFHLREVMDTQKILLVNLSKGRIGEINANLIGMIVVGKILMAALSRVDDPQRGYPPFYLYIDEFQNVTTDSIASILSEARKYKLGLTIAHQFIAQLEERIRDAVFGNVGSLAAFRVGAEDAAFLETQFQPTFDANDLISIENRNAYVRILADGTPTTPFTIRTVAPREADRARIKEIIEHSSRRYATSREQVEAEIIERYH